MANNNDPSRDNGHMLGISRRALVQAASLSFAAFSWPRELRAALSEPDPRGWFNAIDFRYSPPWWQTLICLPDDPDKALVGKEGQLLFDYGLRVDKKGHIIAPGAS